MDAPGWKKFVELLQSNPELILGLAMIVVAVFAFAWWLRSHTGKEHIAALNTRIAALQDGLGLAKDDYARLENIFTKQIELLTAENASLGSPTIANSIRSLSQANTELKTITARLEATEAPDHARFMAGTDRSDTPMPLKRQQHP
jgi:hypothetical protein